MEREMASMEQVGQYTLRFATNEKKAAPRSAEDYAQEARELVAKHLPKVNPSLLETIQKDALEALPQPIMEGKTFIRYPKPDEAAQAMAAFEASLDTRGVDEYTIRYLMHDLTTLSNQMLADYAAKKTISFS